MKFGSYKLSQKEKDLFLKKLQYFLSPIDPQIKVSDAQDGSMSMAYDGKKEVWESYIYDIEISSQGSKVTELWCEFYKHPDMTRYIKEKARSIADEYACEIGEDIRGKLYSHIWTKE